MPRRPDPSDYYGGPELRPARRLHDGGRAVRTLVTVLSMMHGPTCARCGALIDIALSGLVPAGPTVGHRVPVSMGGTDTIENLQLEHRACNLRAGATDRPIAPKSALARAPRSLGERRGSPAHPTARNGARNRPIRRET